MLNGEIQNTTQRKMPYFVVSYTWIFLRLHFYFRFFFDKKFVILFRNLCDMLIIFLILMSVEQFLPPPLNSVADVLDFFHPYQVHCILVDVWNYVRDNVPSPVAFVTNGKGNATRKFGPYSSHKQYCERLRLIMIQHITQVPEKYHEFFVEEESKMEM